MNTVVRRIPTVDQPNLPKQSILLRNRRRQTRLPQIHPRNLKRTPSPKRAGVTRAEKQHNTILSIKKIMEEDT